MNTAHQLIAGLRGYDLDVRAHLCERRHRRSRPRLIWVRSGYGVGHLQSVLSVSARPTARSKLAQPPEAAGMLFCVS